jgi:hypothetical protein
MPNYFSFANKEVERQWKATDSRQSEQPATKCEGRVNGHSTTYIATGNLRTMANPVEREAQLIRQAQHSAAKCQGYRNQTRTRMNETFRDL